MQYLEHFFYYSFRWQLKYFIIMLFVLALSFLLFWLEPSSVNSVGGIVGYILFFYAIFSSAATFGSLGTNQNQFGNSFSGKYLLSLPISKKKLLLCLTLSNLFSIIPMIAAILGLSILQKSGLFDSLKSDGSMLRLLASHSLTVVVCVVLLYFVFAAGQIRRGIEQPRQAFSKGTIYNFLIQAKGVLNFLVYLFAIPMLMIYSREAVLFPIIFFFIACWEVYKTYKVLTDETLSYWVWKRDLISSGFCILLAATFFLITYQYGSFDKVISPSVDKYSFSGDDMFLMGFSLDDQEIQKYINNKENLNTTNTHGFSLIHLFSMLDFDRFNGIEEYFLKDPKLLTLPVRTLRKNCKQMIYCEGVTPLHILAARGNYKILKKALALTPKGVFLENIKGETPLHYSSLNCKYRTSDVLLISSSDKNSVSKDALTPLMQSAAKGCYANTVLLIRSGAEKNYRNSLKQTAEGLAEANGHFELSYIIKMLEVSREPGTEKTEISGETVQFDRPNEKNKEYKKIYPQTQLISKDNLIHAQPEKHGVFYAIDGDHLISGIESRGGDSRYQEIGEQPWFGKDDKSFRKVKSNLLGPIGFKKGAVVTYFSYNEKVKRYVLKENVNINMIKNYLFGGEHEPFYRSFYVKLSDAGGESKVSSYDGEIDKYTGLAYVGNKFVLSSSKTISPKEIVADLSDPNVAKALDALNDFFSKQDRSLISPEVAIVRDYNQMRVISFQEKRNDNNVGIATVIQLSENKFIDISNLAINTMADDFFNIVEAGEFTEGGFVFVFGADHMHGCVNIAVIKNDEVVVFRPECDLAGGC